MIVANLIAKKRDGHAMTEPEIQFLIAGYCQGTVADYQMSAFAMAVCLRGMNDQECAWLTRSMFESGQQLSRTVSDEMPRVDKHSSGGLGDKVSLILAPWLACCGVHVPMISGRGLGLTGGTLDKLESIPGFQVDLNDAQSDQVLTIAGATIIAANETVAPADRRLYALRDVTATVESIGLITASILSKKLAANLDALVMDVKYGDAAFMKTFQDARELASRLCSVGSAAGLPTKAVLSDMNQPLGQAVGNAIEVNESAQLMRGEGFHGSGFNAPALDRLYRLTRYLAATSLLQVGVETNRSQAEARLDAHLASGQVMERFCMMVDAQGGQAKFPLSVAPALTLTAKQHGSVQSINCAAIGQAIIGLGGGRRQVGDAIDHSVGITMHVGIGDQVHPGDPTLTLHAPVALHSELFTRKLKTTKTNQSCLSDLWTRYQTRTVYFELALNLPFLHEKCQK